jgi:hypothetical protein
MTLKKQLLEDITKKQILTNIWKVEEREHHEFEKALGWSKFSKEDTTRVELGEIRQRTVTGFTLQEILPQAEFPHPGIIQTERDPHLQVTHFSSTVHTLWIQMEGPPPDPHRNTHTGQIGGRGIPTKAGFVWVTDGPDTTSRIEQWAQDYLRQHEKLGALDTYAIRQATMKTDRRWT